MKKIGVGTQRLSVQYLVGVSGVMEPDRSGSGRIALIRVSPSRRVTVVKVEGKYGQDEEVIFSWLDRVLPLGYIPGLGNLENNLTIDLYLDEDGTKCKPNDYYRFT